MLYKLAPLNGLCDRLKHVAEYSEYRPHSHLVWCPTDSCPAAWGELFDGQPDSVTVEDVSIVEYARTQAAKCEWFENPDEPSDIRARRVFGLLGMAREDVKDMARFQDRPIGPTSVHVRRGEWDTRIPPHQIEQVWADMDAEALNLIAGNTSDGETLALYSDQINEAVKWTEILKSYKYDVIPPNFNHFDASQFRQTTVKRALADLIEMARAHKVIACGPGGFSRMAAEAGGAFFLQVDLSRFRKRLWVRDEEKAMQERARK